MSNHFNCCLALASGALAVIKRLVPLRLGLNPHGIQRLASALLLPVASYGPNLFVPNTLSAQKLDVFWNKLYI